MSNNGHALHFAPRELKGDVGVVLAAMHNRVHAVSFASEKLRSNSKVLKVKYRLLLI